MDGYDVFTSDGARVGTVAGRHGDALVVETGTILTSRHLLPLAFAEVDEDAAVVRSTLAKELVVDSPKLDGDEVDDAAVASHYGLVGTEHGAPTEGAGAVSPDDPARSADQQALRDGVEPAELERARIREELEDPGWTPGPSGGPIVGRGVNED
ncbi:MAG TPA: hypothetical protein VLB86_01645 [Gaiellaceae bacterium]|nr:hypothetical protein [Gaiellaceae bacterium]